MLEDISPLRKLVKKVRRGENASGTTVNYFENQLQILHPKHRLQKIRSLVWRKRHEMGVPASTRSD